MPYTSTGSSGVKDIVLSVAHFIVTLIFLVLLNMGIARVLRFTTKTSVVINNFKG